MKQLPEQTGDTIRLKNIYKSYQMGQERLTVLKNIDLEVKNGEFLAILGPSGSGKTTLMNIIGCMDRFDAGEYFLAGQAVHAMRDAQLTRLRNRQIGFVFQKYQLIEGTRCCRTSRFPFGAGLSRRTAYRYAAKQASRRPRRPDCTAGPTSCRAASSSAQPSRGRCAARRDAVGRRPTRARTRRHGGLEHSASSTSEETRSSYHSNEAVRQKAKRVVHIVDGVLASENRGDALWTQ
jgi:putative ABC transport system ATP-binding protein